MASASCLKIAGELKIALTRTSRQVMRERCMSMIDSNNDKPSLAHPQPIKVIIKSHVINPAKWN